MSTKIKSSENKRPKRESSRSRIPKSFFEDEDKPKTSSKNASPARNKSSSRKKSPARRQSSPPQKSTSESQSTELQKKPKRVIVKSPKKSESPSWKSPARKSPSRVSTSRKSPSRKSPSRKSPRRKSPSRISPLRLRSEATNMHTSTPSLDIDTESDSDFKSLRPVARSRISRSKADSTPIRDVETREITREYSITKRPSASSNLYDTEQIVHLKNNIFTRQEKNLTEFSDEDDLPVQSKCIDSIESRPYKTIFVTEFGGWFGAMFSIIFLPIFAISLHIFCNDKQCSYQLPPMNLLKEKTFYFDTVVLLSFSAYTILLLLLSALPFGGKKIHGHLSRYGRTSYISNGYISVLAVHLLLLGLEMFGFGVVNYIYEKYVAFAVAAVLHGIFFSIYMYVRSFFVPVSALNPNGDTNSIVYNFFMGREINPVIKDIINVKIFLLRMAFVTLILITTVIVLKSLSLTSPLANITAGQFDLNSLSFDKTCLTVALMWYIYLFDGIFLLEKAWSTTFEMQHEGIGYLSCFIYFSLPSMNGTIIKYVYDYNIKLDNWLLILALLQFIFGYVIYSGSNNQKDAFRKNPYSPWLAHLETIPTTQGKKLIISGLWGFVRHPNYLGNIIILLSFVYFVYNVPPGLVCLMVIPIFMHRAKRDGFRCKQKYDNAWKIYCERVKYMLIPKIY